MAELKEIKRADKNEQTFSKDVKEEVAGDLMSRTLDEVTLFLAGFVQQTGSIVFNNGKMTLDVQTGNAIVARRVFQALRHFYPGIQIEITIRKMIKLKKQAMYVLRITDATKTFFEDIFYFDEDGFVQTIPKIAIDNEDLFMAYVRGLFLGSGSVNNLNLQSYHLEISITSESLAQEVIAELAKYQIEMKLVKRRNQFVLYIKDSSVIGDFLAFIEATSARFAFEDVRITRDMVNSMNRLMNCEVANEQKSQKATEKQITNIQYVLRKLGRGHFNDKETHVIDMRFLYQDATLTELSEYLLSEKNMQISKSGLNHIFRKINKKADDLRLSEEIAAELSADL